MKRRFSPNITRAGRIFRAGIAAVILLCGIIAAQYTAWLGVAVILCSGFVFFEAARGWCVLRACGIKTRL